MELRAQVISAGTLTMANCREIEVTLIEAIIDININQYARLFSSTSTVHLSCPYDKATPRHRQPTGNTWKHVEASGDGIMN